MKRVPMQGCNRLFAVERFERVGKTKGCGRSLPTGRADRDQSVGGEPRVTDRDGVCVVSADRGPAMSAMSDRTTYYCLQIPQPVGLLKPEAWLILR